ncbi:hypothetical protein WMZ97_18390 [Lentibacillus sp. N15]|uniref:hypothetical protein n=1 Tax=Lentibacillus songyuanensis TaxID=3136161 RepID=UPI0031BAFFC0
MIYRGRILIADEAIEFYKKTNLSLAWKVKASWNSESQSLIVDCEPSNLSFNWSWREINRILNLGTDVKPSFASEVRKKELKL